MLSIRYNIRFKSWKIRKDPQKITKIKSFTNKYNWEETNFPLEKDD